MSFGDPYTLIIANMISAKQAKHRFMKAEVDRHIRASEDTRNLLHIPPQKSVSTSGIRLKTYHFVLHVTLPIKKFELIKNVEVLILWLIFVQEKLLEFTEINGRRTFPWDYAAFFI